MIELEGLAPACFVGRRSLFILLDTSATIVMRSTVLLVLPAILKSCFAICAGCTSFLVSKKHFNLQVAMKEELTV